MDGTTVTSIREFIDAVEDQYEAWDTPQRPWFRGEPDPRDPDVEPLVPKLFRDEHDENALLQFFRMRAPVKDLPIVPDRGAIDQWMFLARHVGLPTRLLDWTEGALIALYFALEEKEEGSRPAVWMLDPHLLNSESADGAVPNAPTITWSEGQGRPVDRLESFGSLVKDVKKDHVDIYETVINVAFENFRHAWTGEGSPTDLPVAIYPTVIHPLMSAQKSCFTIHGYYEHGLGALIETQAKCSLSDCLVRFDIGIEREAGLEELRRLGISRDALFPNASGLADELERQYCETGERP